VVIQILTGGGSASRESLSKQTPLPFRFVSPSYGLSPEKSEGTFGNSAARGDALRCDSLLHLSNSPSRSRGAIAPGC
jgi:hypothetical protein